METMLNLNLHQDAFYETLEEDMHGFLTKPAFLTSTGITTLLTPRDKNPDEIRFWPGLFYIRNRG